MNPKLSAIRSGQRAELGPAPEDAAKGQVTWASDKAGAKEPGCGCGAEQGQVGCRMDSAPRHGDQPDPPQGLTWRLCSAASSSRCRFAQTSRCSGKVGPKPAIVGLSAASREDRPALLGLRLALPPRLRSEPHLSCAGHSPADPWAGAAAATARAAGRAGRGERGRGYMGIGRGFGLRAPSPPAAMATTAGLRAGGGRGGGVCPVSRATTRAPGTAGTSFRSRQGR